MSMCCECCSFRVPNEREEFKSVCEEDEECAGEGGRMTEESSRYGCVDREGNERGQTIWCEGVDVELRAFDEDQVAVCGRGEVAHKSMRAGGGRMGCHTVEEWTVFYVRLFAHL